METNYTYHATKYDSARDEVIAILASPLEGFGRAATGNVEAPTGFVELVVLDETHDLDFTDHTNYPPGDLCGETARLYGVTTQDVLGAWLVISNDQGFVTVLGHDNASAAMRHFSQIEKAYLTWEDQDDDNN